MVREAMGTQLDSHSFKTWFSPTRAMGFREDSLIVLVPNEVFVGYLESEYGQQVRAVAGTEVEFVLVQAEADRVV